MKSGIRRLRGAAKDGPPVQLSSASLGRGHIFNIGAGRDSIEAQLRAYHRSGTVNAIVSLLAESAASPRWRLYKKQPVDGRRRYSTADTGDDQRIEVVNHAALALWNMPNDFHSGFEFREGCNQHFDLCGMTFWVLNKEVTTFPVSMWYVNPSRMEPVPDPNGFQLGWIYSGPDGEQVPLKYDEVILEKRPDPLNPFLGSGPVSSIMNNIRQQDYATQYQANLFVSGATPGGVLTVPQGIKLQDWEFDELIDRWRENHQGVARAGRVGVLENGIQWTPAGQSNKDLEYGNLRLANRDEIREAWRMHKSMLGTVEDVNRANAQTAEESFSAWHQLTRLDRRKDTLNCKLLPMFYPVGSDIPVEFDYDDPSPVNQEAANNELLVKAQAAQALITAGFEPHDVLEAIGLPDMDVVETATQQQALPPGWVPGQPAAPAAPPAGSDDGTDMTALLPRISLNGHRKLNGSHQ